MQDNPNKLSQFWRELKRRRVVHVITVYASATFVIIELINNLTEPLNLPPSLATIVIVILAVGFPLSIILSWLYDLTGRGVEKTKPLEEVTEEEKTSVPNAWRIATIVSFVVIIGLVTWNIVGGTRKLKVGDIQSLVILPFENYTGDDQLENMVSSMHSLLIGDMGRISGLRVIGKTSSKMYNEVDLSATDIARELNVDAIVEATVTCLGDSVCMQFRLVSTKGEEDQIWIGDYREDKEQILNLYNRITRQIAEEVMIELTPEEERMLDKSVTIDKEAFDAYLRSYAHWDDLSEESTRKGIEYLNTALEKDSTWAPLWVGLAQLWAVRIQMGFEPPETGIPKVFGYLAKALELDPDYSDIHLNTAGFAVWLEWNWDKGEREYLEALSLNPNDVMARIYYAHLLISLQRNEEATLQGRIAVELDPLNPLIQALYAVVIASNKDWEASMVHLEKALAIDPYHFFANNLLDMVAIHCEEYDKVFEACRKFLPFEEKFFQSIDKIYREEGYSTAYEAILLEMEKREYGTPCDIAVRYNLLDQYEKAMDWLEIGFEFHDPNMPYIGTGIFSFDSLYNNPRFIAIMEKMNLPFPTK